MLKDTSPQAMSPVIQEMTITVGFITIVFLGLVAFVFWLRSLGEPDPFADNNDPPNPT